MKFPCLLCGISTVAFAAPPDPDEAAYPAIERFVEVLEAVRKRHAEMARQMRENKDLNPELRRSGSLSTGARCHAGKERRALDIPPDLTTRAFFQSHSALSRSVDVPPEIKNELVWTRLLG